MGNRANIVLTQESGGQQYRVKSVSNTVQIQIGQLVSRERVADWCARPRVNVRIVGMTTEANLDQIPEDLAEPARLKFNPGPIKVELPENYKQPVRK